MLNQRVCRDANIVDCLLIADAVRDVEPMLEDMADFALTRDATICRVMLYDPYVMIAALKRLHAE